MLTKTQVLALFLGAISAVELTNEGTDSGSSEVNNTETTENNTETTETNTDTNEADTNTEQNTEADSNTETNQTSTYSVHTILPIELLNGPGTESKVPADQSLTPLSSGVSCFGNTRCEDFDGEKCGNFQFQGRSINMCVAENFCGSLGRINNDAFTLQCWQDPQEGEIPVQPAIIDAETNLSELQGLITKFEPWHGVPNLFVSPRFNYQDGWWILKEGLWVETDKPIDNRCFVDLQCPPQDGVERCCGRYPDSNNRRCMAKSLHGNPLTVGPVTFTPKCDNLMQVDDEEPINMGDNVAEGALAEAAEALDQYYIAVDEDAKDSMNYESMNEEDKAAFDLEQQKIKEKRNGLITDLKAIIGYEHDDCDYECKIRFQEELLKWEKERYITCSEDPVGISCRQANEIKIDEETARAGSDNSENYYKNMTDEDREIFHDNRKTQIRALESTLAAAWIENNQPVSGEAGSSCAELKCTNVDHCCGTSTPKVGAFVNDKLENVCVDKNSLLYVDSLGREFDHVCAATKMMVSAVAAATALYSLM